MNGSEARYNSEYVEIQTSLEHIRTKLESIENSVGQTQQTLAEFHEQMDKNRSDIAGIKSAAAILGGLAGTFVAVLSRFLFAGRG